MDIQIELMRLQEQAERSMHDSIKLGEDAWAASYQGQAYAYKQAREVVRKLMQRNADESLSFPVPKMTVSGSHP